MRLNPAHGRADMRVVSQISPPIRIVLVLAVAVMGLYMLFLRPKEEVIPPATTTPPAAQGAVSEPGKVKEAAEGAVQAANGQLAQQEGVDGVQAGETAAATGTSTSTGAGTAPGGAAATTTVTGDLEGLPKPVAKAIRKDKVLVLLFWNGKSVDDKAVRAALSKVDRWDGRVVVHVAPLKKISKYGRIARGVDVDQSPTIVIADRDLRAETLVGYVDTTTIDQAVVDALRNSTGLFTSSYLKAVDQVCRRHSNAMAMIPGYYTLGDARKADTRMAAYHTAATRFVADFKAVKAPKKWRAFHTASVADMNAILSAIGGLSAAVGPNTALSSVRTQYASYLRSAKPTGKRGDRRFEAQGLHRCGSQF
jgi:hypothetical protein